MDEAGIMSFQSYETLAPEDLKDEGKDKDSEGKCVSSVQKSEQQTSLHSCKEKKRRLQIKAACQRMCNLLPFVKGPLDIATTLELTAHYVSYLKETLPPSLLSKIDETVKKNSALQKNGSRPQKKCYEWKTVRRKRNAAERGKPAPKKSKKDSVPAESSQKKTGRRVKCLPMIVPKPLVGTQMLPQVEALTAVRAPPILLDKSTVPWGQMLPVRQDQFHSDSFQFAESNWINPSCSFMNPASCDIASASTGPTQVGPDSSSSQMSWDGSYGSMADFPPMNFGQPCNPPEQSAVVDFSVTSEQADSFVIGPSIHSADFTHKLFTSKFQAAAPSCDDQAPRNVEHQVSEDPHDARCALESDPLADSPSAEVGSFWMDLLLESSNENFRFPDPNLVDTILSFETGYQQ